MNESILETTETNQEAAPRREFPIWLAWTLTGVLILAVLSPALVQGGQALTQALKLSQQIANTLQLFLWAVVSVTFGYVTSRLLGKRISDPQMWLALTAAAWLLIGVHASYPLYYSVVQDPNQYPEAGTYRQIVFILSNVVGMGTMSFAGWLVLRLNYRRAAYWILWSIGGAAVGYGLFYLIQTSIAAQNTSLATFLSSTVGDMAVSGVYYLVAFAISGVGLQRALQNPRPAVPMDRLKWKTFMALWVFALFVGEAANDIFGQNGIQTTLQNALHYPNWVGAGVSGLITGLILGLAGWLALNDYLPKAGWWLLAVAVGETITPVLGNYLFGQVHLTQENVFWFALGIRILATLPLILLQTAILYVLKVRQPWYWIPIGLGIEIVSYLLLFYANQKASVLLWAGLTGLGLVFLLRGGLGNLWILQPSGQGEPIDDTREDDRMVINERLRLALESRPRIQNVDDQLHIFPNKQVEPDLMEWLLTERGNAKVVTLAEPPEEESELAAEAPAVLSEEDFESADREPSSGEDQERLRIGLDENALKKLQLFIQENPEAKLYLAMDGNLLTHQAAEVGVNSLVWDGLTPEDAFLYTAILSQPALSTAYQATLAEDGV